MIRKRNEQCGECTIMVKAIGITIACLVAVAGIGYALMASGGKPIGSDLSNIGQGRPAVVLAYENFSPTGGEALNRLRKVRGDFDARLDFAVADLGTPQGRAFAQRFKLLDSQAVFLAQDGRPLSVTSVAVDENDLRSYLESSLEAVE